MKLERKMPGAASWPEAPAEPGSERINGLRLVCRYIPLFGCCRTLQVDDGRKTCFSRWRLCNLSFLGMGVTRENFPCPCERVVIFCVGLAILVLGSKLYGVPVK